MRQRCVRVCSRWASPCHMPYRSNFTSAVPWYALLCFCIFTGTRSLPLTQMWASCGRQVANRAVIGEHCISPVMQCCRIHCITGMQLDCSSLHLKYLHGRYHCYHQQQCKSIRMTSPLDASPKGRPWIAQLKRWSQRGRISRLLPSSRADSSASMHIIYYMIYRTATAAQWSELVHIERSLRLASHAQLLLQMMQHQTQHTGASSAAIGLALLSLRWITGGGDGDLQISKIPTSKE